MRNTLRPALFACTAAVVLCAAALAASCALAATPDAHSQARRLGRGVNILGYDPIWTQPDKARFKTRHFAAIRKAGFTSVRINLQAFDHMNASGRLDETWLRTLDWAVRGATDNGLMVILDEHDFNVCGQDPVGCEPKLLAFWAQVAERYKNAPDTVVFELMNEPNRGMTDALWNRYLAEALAVVRRSNPTRTVIIGPAFWNNLSHLDQLELPEGDRNLIVTFHYYTPMAFTHQGAPWNPDTPNTGVAWGSAEDLALMSKDFATVDAWAKAHDRPIYLGEFGAYDKGEMIYRARYTAAVARSAECHGWGWGYWQFDSDFIAYDMAKDGWIEPIRAALIPAGESPACP